MQKESRTRRSNRHRVVATSGLVSREALSPALMLLHHMDVVPANKASWRTDPLSGDILDGYLYGRGALDTKSSGILHLATLVALHNPKCH